MQMSVSKFAILLYTWSFIVLFSAEANTPQHFSQECILNIQPPGYRYMETESILGNFQAL